MGIKKWAKRKAAILSLAMSNVEKDMLGQNGKQLSKDVNQVRRNTDGQLMDALIHGKVTQEVMDLRWRTYKVLRASEDTRIEFEGYDENDMPIYKIVKTDPKNGLDKIKLEPTDNYPIELVLNNDEITKSIVDTLYNDFIDVETTPILNKDKHGTVTGATHGNISSDEYYATSKPEKPLKVTRMFYPKFNIENFTKKLHVRSIDETNKLLEFYVSKYPDEDNRKTYLFINEVIRAIDKPNLSNMLEIDSVDFITYKTLGAYDFMEYQYKIKNFDKIVDFNGHYVIKFLAEVKIDGVSLVEKHRQTELDEKYEKKEKKKK